MWKLAVGEKFAERTQWPDNSFEFRYFNGNYMFQYCAASPSLQDIEKFKQGRVWLGHHFEEGIIFFLIRIDGFLGWSDQAFSINLVPLGNRTLPDGTEGYTLLNLVLVDADTGIVRAIRSVTMSPALSLRLRSEMLQQRCIPFDKAAHNAAIERVYRKYPQSKDLARVASNIEHAGAGARELRD